MTEIRVCFPEFRASIEGVVARAHELRAASAAIRQSLSETHKALAEEFDRARATQAAVREQLASLRATERQTTPLKPPNAVLQALAILGKDESDLDDLTHDLIAAYRDADATGDDGMQRELARALMLIGRHLAAQIGPKASGAVLN